MNRLVLCTLMFCAGLYGMDANTLTRPKTEQDKCYYWHSKIAPTAKQVDSPNLNESHPDVIMGAIDCLLQLEGDKRPARFSGATNPSVSQTFKEPAAVEVAALYYISYLFYQRWDHGDVVALRNRKGEYNTAETVKKSYQAYRKWFRKIRKMGLEKARKLQLDPLADTNIDWH